LKGPTAFIFPLYFYFYSPSETIDGTEEGLGFIKGEGKGSFGL